ncbi:RICIN domain-containing protein [Krasilnikovia sp. M28-CT-15]|uniref:RICIN domain-containing protein n=1 Tax=Krasilnikovia sp. M28-CT-15 TaxID=3373540 RepID=UPI00399D068C
MAALALLFGLLAIPATSAHAASSTAAAASDVISNSFYMVNQQSNRCAEIPGYSKKNGAHVDQFTCAYDVHTNEMWEFRYVKRSHGVALHQIINAASRKCMNVAGASTANGAAVVQWPCSRSATNGLWYRDEVAGYHVWRNGHSGKCLNVAGASKKNGAWLVQYTCGNYRNEHWKYVSMCEWGRDPLCVQPPWWGW